MVYMGLNNSDFSLSDHQVKLLNEYMSCMGKASKEEGEDPPCSIRVVFEWVPPFGRFVTAYFDGVVDGLEIETAPE